MALSDSPERANRKSVRRRAVNAETNKHWSDAQKIEAVTLWLSLGNLRLTAATLGIPEITVRQWKNSQWWKDIADELVLQDKIQFSATAQRIVEKSMGVINDRLENGDWLWDSKAGQLVRKPVSMRDAVHAATQMIDKKVLLDKSDIRQDSAESVEQRLTKLMDKFAAMASPPAQVTDIVYVKETSSATNEEWEEGLQLRQGISETPGASEESGGQECSEEDN